MYVGITHIKGSTDKFSRLTQQDQRRLLHGEVAPEAVSHSSETADKGFAQETPLEGLDRLTQLTKHCQVNNISQNSNQNRKPNKVKVELFRKQLLLYLEEIEVQ